MKNLKYIIPIFLLMLCVILFVIYSETTCSLENCDNTRVNGGKYCSEHTCETEGCVNKKAPGSYSCYSCHEDSLNNQDDNKITLTDSQVNKAKQAVKEYCDSLMEKQPNLLAINLINDYPEYVTEYSCSFYCNVVREDDNTNLATIYLSINSDGSFEVDRLMYDE